MRLRSCTRLVVAGSPSWGNLGRASFTRGSKCSKDAFTLLCSSRGRWIVLLGKPRKGQLRLRLEVFQGCFTAPVLVSREVVIATVLLGKVVRLSFYSCVLVPSFRCVWVRLSFYSGAFHLSFCSVLIEAVLVILFVCFRFWLFRPPFLLVRSR